MAVGSSLLEANRSLKSARGRERLRRLAVRFPASRSGERDERPRHDPVEQIGLCRLEFDQPS
jgi:hypothetical protein